MTRETELLREAVELLRVAFNHVDRDTHCKDHALISTFLAKIDAAEWSLPEGAAIAAEYLEAKRVIDAGPSQPDGSHRPPRSWKHNDPEVLRWHKAAAGLNTLAASARNGGA